MRIEKYCVKDLMDLIESDFYKKTEDLPISQHRAISHFHNPHAHPDDEVLYLLFKEDKLIAYRLLLPDTVYINNQPMHMTWLSCMWVHHTERRKGHAQKLSNMALDWWKGKIMYTNFAPESHALYQSLNSFQSLQKYEGIRGYVRLNLATLIPQRKASLKIFTPIFKLTDFVFNIFNDLRLKLFKSKSDASIKVIYENQIDETTFDFIKPFQQNEFMRRDRQTLNWILKYPWMIEMDTPDEAAKKYYFSSVAKRFEQPVLKIFRAEKLIGVLILTIRNDTLKIAYAYFHEEHTAIIADVLRKVIIDKKISTLTTFYPLLRKYFQNNKSPFLFIRPQFSQYMYGKGFPKEILSQLYHFQDGDGDVAFT